MINKKGSHVGIILSFVIFIFFVVSLYTILYPETQKKEEKKQILESASELLIKNMSYELISNVLNINQYNPPSNPPCFSVPNISDKNVIVKKLGTSDIKQSKIESDNLLIEWDNLKKFEIYHSEKFAASIASLSSCNVLLQNQYNFGVTKTEKYVFIDDVNGIKTNYENKYIQLKDSLNIPAGVEFWFEFVKDDGTKISPTKPDIDSNIEKYKKETIVEYFDSNANIKVGYLNFEVW